jgi:hypothetical protein
LSLAEALVYQIQQPVQKFPAIQDAIFATPLSMMFPGRLNGYIIPNERTQGQEGTAEDQRKKSMRWLTFDQRQKDIEDPAYAARSSVVLPTEDKPRKGPLSWEFQGDFKHQTQLVRCLWTLCGVHGPFRA